jgi:sterol desaturase/sphingolipid hydroxylase (fatty acid hydroxylase superfamily)
MQPVVIVVCAAAVMIAVEQLRPGVKQPLVPGWIARLVLLNLAQIGVVFLGAYSWDLWLAQWKLFDASVLPAPVGAAIGYVVITFVFYWWHRARHEVPLLWRYLHVVHHSPARIECAMSFYKHPLEIAINGVLCSFVLYVLVGLPAATAATVVAITGVAELSYHWNVRSPYWLGFLFQRPEMHRRHHERGWHRSNYSDLPIWDMLFGTFENPRETPEKCGFAGDAERHLGRLLIGKRTP